jgi:hypothetical protein
VVSSARAYLVALNKMIDYLSVVNSRMGSRDDCDADTPLGTLTGDDTLSSSSSSNQDVAKGGSGVKRDRREDENRRHAGSGSGMLVSA